MPVTATRNRRRQHRPPILKQISHLFLQIDLHSGLRAQRNHCAEEDRPAYAKDYGTAGSAPEAPHIEFKPARGARVANVYGLNPVISPGNDRYQLWVKLAVSVIGPFMITDAGLSVPEKEPVPVPVQLPKL